MAMTCQICHKKSVHGNNVSHSNIKTKRTGSPTSSACAPSDGSPADLRCSRCLRSGKVQRNV
jgi:large subunit ribosomal protein L28